ncbi:uncharacterized protein LAESUDRAFT_269015 [Laetiporus sulphureus 93-53]|uniref:Zn(2)-C6 fungal-type domain-containing protein n=1 Tax=Laetiporus sulphureus 93-53 TaxID=1314785 RepID=A0A165H940_9APHY|nr:uncharacterized protein LAESUDRAFT_269015 [Laetiporus sulphureus 93-53]KZT11413.1 hypothetical protein LAESUDRAFT_269015 [Laetiporus sulphureus 93-53]
MSPRSPTSRSSSTSPRPTGRRVPGQPKSTRQQYSACGACRMRRVRCDLKDLPVSPSGQHPPCSNCSERGLKCVDEFAEVKAVKLLRRGRRLQQVEAVYGQNSSDEGSLHSVPSPRSVIPRLRPEFFNSPFFHRFHTQRPILEPMEYCNRYYEFCKGNKEPLQAPGQLVALVLVVWAASFGVNEYGVEELYDGQVNARRRKDRINEMVQELLSLIDIHGLLRKPSWDGVRVLLLTLPLTREVQTPLERLTMYEATISQVYSICSLASACSVNSGQGEYVDALVRARIFWYAHVFDGVTSGLRGGRILLTDDDLTSFEATLPPVGESSATSAVYTFAFRYATIPIRIASVCRDVHAALTGPRARQSREIGEVKLHDAWETLDQCWKDFEGLRQLGTDGFVQTEDVERFIDGWQIFIFECHNVIREALKQRLVARPAPEAPFLPDGHPSPRSREYDAIVRLHAKSNTRCQAVVRHVVSILRRNLGTQFFQFDTALIRDGCFFAGFLLAGDSGSAEDVEVCLQALREMRWTFCKSDEREQTIRMIWESRLSQTRNGRSFTGSPLEDDLLRSSASEHPYGKRSLNRPISVPPLSLSLCTVPAALSPASAPSTACSTNSNWPTSTPPSSAGTGMYDGSMPSQRASPTSPFAHSPPSSLSIDTLHSKSAFPSTPSLVLEGPGQTGRIGEQGGLDQVFYFQQYGFSGASEPLSSHHMSHPPTILPPPATTDYHAASTFFDHNSVTFSNPTISQSNACSGVVVPSSTVSNDGRQLGDEHFY